MEEKDLDLIEQYLNQELSEDELAVVEKRLEEDEEFRQAKLESEDLIAGIQSASRKEVLEKLKAIEEQLPEVIIETKTVPLLRRPFVYGLAASFSILILSVYFFLGKEPGNYETLFQDHFEVYPNIVAPTVRSTETEKSEKEFAYYTYDLGNYEKAIELLKEVSSKEDEGASMLYLGMCYLMIGDNDNAIGSFQAYKDSEFELFLPQVNWFLGLTYVRKGEVDKAKEVWEEIPEGNSYRERVDKIYDQMRINQ